MAATRSGNGSGSRPSAASRGSGGVVSCIGANVAESMAGRSCSRPAAGVILLAYGQDPRRYPMSVIASAATASRRFRLARCLGVLLACPAYALPAAGQSEAIAFTGASVIDPGTSGVLSNATVVVREGVIVSVAEGGEAPAAARTIDLGGRFLVPGLIDAHVHIGTLEAARRALLSGVTTARSMGAGFFADVGLRELFRRGGFAGPEILAAGYHVRPRPAEGLFL
ncbi:MAG: amidohydrolase family protein, partial [Gemmatimonadales bacterium]|nr:amidohydrolase family protein [Gemmatimonadales bacterium]